MRIFGRAIRPHRTKSQKVYAKDGFGLKVPIGSTLSHPGAAICSFGGAATGPTSSCAADSRLIASEIDVLPTERRQVRVGFESHPRGPYRTVFDFWCGLASLLIQDIAFCGLVCELEELSERCC